LWPAQCEQYLSQWRSGQFLKDFKQFHRCESYNLESGKKVFIFDKKKAHKKTSISPQKSAKSSKKARKIAKKCENEQKSKKNSKTEK
jgi:hypothetical protein